MRIPANGMHLQLVRADHNFPADVFLSSSFYSRSFALFAGKIRIRINSVGPAASISPTHLTHSTGIERRKVRR